MTYRRHEYRELLGYARATPAASIIKKGRLSDALVILFHIKKPPRPATVSVDNRTGTGWPCIATRGRQSVRLTADLDTQFLDGLQGQAAMRQVILALVGIDCA